MKINLVLIFSIIGCVSLIVFFIIRKPQTQPVSNIFNPPSAENTLCGFDKPNIKDARETECESGDCKARLAAFGALTKTYDEKTGTCSAEFDCAQVLPLCPSSTSNDLFEGIQDYQLCRDPNTKDLTGQICIKGACSENKCGSYYCNNKTGKCDFKPDDTNGSTDPNNCGNCKNLCESCGGGDCELVDSGIPQIGIISKCSNCPAPSGLVNDLNGKKIDWRQNVPISCGYQCAPPGSRVGTENSILCCPAVLGQLGQTGPDGYCIGYTGPQTT